MVTNHFALMILQVGVPTAFSSHSLPPCFSAPCVFLEAFVDNGGDVNQQNKGHQLKLSDGKLDGKNMARKSSSNLRVTPPSHLLHVLDIRLLLLQLVPILLNPNHAQELEEVLPLGSRIDGLCQKICHQLTSR